MVNLNYIPVVLQKMFCGDIIMRIMPFNKI